MWNLHVLSVLASVSSEHFSFLPQLKDMLIWSIDYSELPVGVNVSVEVCLSLC